MEFKERLMQLRKERGWSQEELGARLSVTRQTVSKWELGQTTPELSKLIELGALFEISIDELVGREQKKEKETEKPQGQETLFQKAYGYGFSFGHPYQTMYEYKSERKIGKVPLVHIHYGSGNCTAKGIIAIGNIAVGVVSIGFISFGVLAFGLIGMGLLALGLCSLGVIAAGLVAIGALFGAGLVAVGYFAAGGVASGMGVAVGGIATGNHLAIGDVAAGNIAVGEEVDGAVTFVTDSGLRGVDWGFVYGEAKARCPEFVVWFLRMVIKIIGT